MAKARKKRQRETVPVEPLLAWFGEKSGRRAQFSKDTEYQSATVTNWKRRGQLPRAEIQRVAAYMGISPDEYRRRAGLKPLGGALDVVLAKQRPIEGAMLLRDFEELPPLLQEHVAKVARELRELIQGVKPQYRQAISAPPSDPERYASWETAIKGLWHATNHSDSTMKEKKR